MPRTKQFVEEEVLEKAMALFWQRGYYSTSVNDLVQALGISRASMYSTFGDKEALFEKAFDRYSLSNKLNVEQLFERSTSIKEGFYQLLAQGIAQDTEGPVPKGCLLVNTANELLPEDEKLKAKVEQHSREFMALFEKLVRRGMERNEIPQDKDPYILARYIFTLYSGLKIMAKIQPDRKALLANLEEGMKVLDKD